MPLVTQSDPGSENYGVANGHTTLRHMFDPSLQEISWSQLRCQFTPGFEDLLDDGVHTGWYDPNDPLDFLLFRWLFIPWLQVELDTWKDSHNTALKHADKNKILPHGHPQLIFEAPHMYDSLDFKVEITPEAVQQVHEHYAPSDDPVFILNISFCWPSINFMRDYLGDMLVKIRDIYVNEPTAALEAAARATVTDEGPEAQPVIPLTMGLQELRNGDAVVGSGGFYYMGGAPEGSTMQRVSDSHMVVGESSLTYSVHARQMTESVDMVVAPFSDDETPMSDPEW
ncbi:hypothetical protein K439DRAFT_1622452 [Ramaria rubella]|nr:hypothetical protein K439DRAFT_1622452 [Ramaria rubella]